MLFEVVFCDADVSVIYDYNWWNVVRFEYKLTWVLFKLVIRLFV